MGGLLAFYKAVVRTGNDGDRHLQLPVFVLEGAGRRNHKSRFGSTGPDLRRPHSLSSGKPWNFLGTGLGPKIFRRRKGHINLLKRGVTVWLKKSPINGMAGGDKRNTSARAFGY
jgi:hypothetical protein